MTEKLSHVEHVKADSDKLRGTIKTDLDDAQTPFSEDMYNLLKFHGVYQGYNRDTATERKKLKLDKEYEMMIRVRIPGGRMNRAQYLHFDALADQYGGGKLRFTTRQAIQYHNILKGDLHATIAGINESLFTTEAACGDVVRNVTTIAAPIHDAIHQRLFQDADLLSAALLPRSNAYAEIWLDNEKFADIHNPSVNKSGGEVEDLYGTTYLPRKFKIGITVPQDNSVDVLTNDLAIVALFDDHQNLLGYNIHVGGGLGITHNKAETYPRLATPICFVGPQDLLAAARAVVTVHRDWGDRTNRKHARIKYVVQEQGEAVLGIRSGRRDDIERHRQRVGPELKARHHISTGGSYIMALGFVITAIYLLHSLVAGRKAPANPWGGASLEWQCSSPPPHDNFSTTPAVGDCYDFSAVRWTSRSRATWSTPRRTSPHPERDTEPCRTPPTLTVTPPGTITGTITGTTRTACTRSIRSSRTTSTPRTSSSSRASSACGCSSRRKSSSSARCS